MSETIKTAVLLGYRCNNNCRFCLSRHKDNEIRPLNTIRAKEEIKNAAARGSTFIDFLGGEPTLRKDLPELISFAKENGFTLISMTTNGRMMSDRKYTEKLVDAGLNSAIFSIHGHTSEIHDYLTQVKGSYAEVVAGLKNFKKTVEAKCPGAHISTNTVMVKPNLKFLPKIAEHNIALGSTNLEFIFPDPKGACWDNFEELVPRLSEMIEPIRGIILAGKKHHIKHCVVRYLPLCYMYGNFQHLSEWQARGRLREQHVGPDIINLNVERGRRNVGRFKGPQCAGCKRSPECEGIFKEYVLKRGFEELIPMP